MKKADKNKTINLEKEGFKKENIEGTEFYGEAVIITINGGLYQTIFMLSYGDGIWSDQFSGPKERWAEAVKILKKLKRKEYPVVVANGTGKFHYRI